jgi:hypothetical protein
MPPTAPVNPRLLFVTGVFRSGTSMLYASLNQHPSIAILYEPDFQSHDMPQRVFLHESWLENANAWSKFLYRHGFPHYPKEAARHFRRPEDFYQSYAARKQAAYGGEKSPPLVGFLPQLAERFPHAKIITISRQPAAVINSIQNAAKAAPWFARRHMLERSLFGQEKMLQDSILLQNQGANILHLTYESFTSDPESQCRRICDYLDLPFDPKMTTLQGSDLDPVYDGPHHLRVRSGEISPSPAQTPALDPEWLHLLESHWQRTRDCLALLSSGQRPIPRPPAPSPQIQSAIAKGRRLFALGKWKRRIYQTVPAEFIRVFRAAKVLVQTSRSIQAEKYSPAEMLRLRIATGILGSFSIAVGGFAYIQSHGDLSPLPFFILPVLASGWFFGRKQFYLFSLLGAAVWTLGPKLTFTTGLPVPWVAWNLFSRTGFLVILGIFAWHLKATLLLHQSRKD